MFEHRNFLIVELKSNLLPVERKASPLRPSAKPLPTQRAQYGLVKQYALNYMGIPDMIEGIPRPPKEPNMLAMQTEKGPTQKKEPKIMAQYLKTESIGSIGSIILAILEVQVLLK